MKVAVNFRVDLNKLDISRAYEGQNGSRTVDLTCFISPAEPDQYGQHGGIQQSTTTEERTAGMKMPYVGNVKAFWSEGVTIVKEAQPAPFTTQQVAPPKLNAQAPKAEVDFDNDIPF
jgi:hypothetical protein|tara:strand:+ start:105 stop:455 length:351 start_codon:yes stop_codon:yes gene_type:complete